MRSASRVTAVGVSRELGMVESWVLSTARASASVALDRWPARQRTLRVGCCDVAPGLPTSPGAARQRPRLADVTVSGVMKSWRENDVAAAMADEVGGSLATAAGGGRIVSNATSQRERWGWRLSTW